MKTKFGILTAGVLLILSIAMLSVQQDDRSELLRYDGLYVAKTHEISIGDNVIQTYDYVRFYEDGTVISQAVSDYDPGSVSAWLHKEDGGKYERHGTFTVLDKAISFVVNNEGLPDKDLEGPMENHYQGEIIGPDQLLLTVSYSSGTELQTTYKFAPFSKE